MADVNYRKVNEEAIEELLRRGAVRNGGLIVITKGVRSGVEGQTNLMRVMRVGERKIGAELKD